MNSTWRGSLLCVPEIPRGEHFIFKSLLHYSAFSQFTACIQKNKFIKLIVYTNYVFFFLKLSIQIIFKFRLAGVTLQPSYVSSKVQWYRHSGSDFEKTTSGRWDVKLLWSSTHVCVTAALHRPIPCFIYSGRALRFPFAALDKKKVVSLACRTAATLHQSSHCKWRKTGKPFVFVVFSLVFFFLFFLPSYRKLGIRAAHQAGPHNCLLRAGQLLGFHLQLASVRFHH